MMKKKILIATAALSIMVAGVVSAASMWGTYKGNDIIRLTVDGDPVKITDVPAINYNNRTMIPIYLLQQAGIQYSWDQQNKTVDILPQPHNNNQYTDQDIANVKLWSSCADYIQKLETFGSDYSIVAGQISALLLASNDGILDRGTLANMGIQLGNSLKKTHNSYFNIFNTNSKVVHNFYNQMNESDKNLSSIETDYDSAANNLTDAYSYLTKYITDKQQSNYDSAVIMMNSALSKLSTATATARTEFNMFQTAIINY